jgi:hypothetical protein
MMTNNLLPYTIKSLIARNWLGIAKNWLGIA